MVQVGDQEGEWRLLLLYRFWRQVGGPGLAEGGVRERKQKYGVDQFERCTLAPRPLFLINKQCCGSQYLLSSFSMAARHHCGHKIQGDRITMDGVAGKSSAS